MDENKDDEGAAWHETLAAEADADEREVDALSRELSEIDYANGNAPFHWSPYKGGVLPGVLSSDVGFWDAFRTTFSLLALVRPDHLAEELEGFLNTWRENGFVPQWPHPAGGG